MIFTDTKSYPDGIISVVIERKNGFNDDSLLFSINSITQARQVEDELIKLVRDIAKWRLKQESKE